MKIGIASDDKKHIARHFGRTRGFVISEISDGQVVAREYRENNFTHHGRTGNHDHAEGQAHHHSHGAILKALEDCNVVMARGMGRRIYEDLRNAGIESKITAHDTVEGALAAFVGGSLDDHPDRGCQH